jgi:hypothetical protein
MRLEIEVGEQVQAECVLMCICGCLRMSPVVVSS